ncbi:MAG: hypothetical protein MZW92_65020 [Comamonadaceae bacterium]|nr:hypothetical protein [Comamonadaceae bacterium]
MVQARDRRPADSLELVARYPADERRAGATHFTRLTVDARRRVAAPASVETAPLRLAGRAWAAARSAARCSPPPTTPTLPDAVAVQMAEIFSADIDFHRELRKGDTFSVVYEALTADGEPVAWNEGAGRVLAAEFVNARPGATRRVWFDGAGSGKGGYYDARRPQHAAQPSCASPMEFSRVTSGFAMRLHPILQTWRAHKGVDYARADRHAGAHRRRRRGRLRRLAERLRQRRRRSSTATASATLYAHLSRIDVRAGPARRAGPAHRRRRRHRLGHRPAPALRVPRRRPAPGPAAHRASAAEHGDAATPPRARASPQLARGAAGASCGVGRGAAPAARAASSRPAGSAPRWRCYVGLMSGTSLDGVDAVLADFGTRRRRGVRGASSTGRSTPRCAPSCWR